MPNFVSGDVHIQAALTDLSVAFSQGQATFKSGNIFPTVPVMKQADKFFVFDRQDWLRSDAAKRAPGAESAEGGWSISEGTYFADRFALHVDIDDPTRANADPALSNLDADSVDYLTGQIELRKEKSFVADFMTTGVFDGASSSTDMTGQAAPASTTSNFLHWSDVASTPIQDVRGEAHSIVKNTGRFPTGMAVGPDVFAALADHPDILERIKYTQTGIVGEALIASLFGIDRFDTLFATEDTAAESAAASFSFLAGKVALLYHSPGSPGLRTPSAGYRFVWTGMAGAPREGARIKRFRIEPKESDRIEAEEWHDDKLISSVLGVFFATAVV